MLVIVVWSTKLEEGPTVVPIFAGVWDNGRNHSVRWSGVRDHIGCKVQRDHYISEVGAHWA